MHVFELEFSCGATIRHLLEGVLVFLKGCAGYFPYDISKLKRVSRKKKYS